MAHASNIPKWSASGDWFDVCKCNIPCPCEFAQAPTYDDCDGILAYNIKKGSYGEIPLEARTYSSYPLIACLTLLYSILLS